MEIITLLKANMLKKKGTFISIIIMVLLITAMLLSMLSVKQNYTAALNDTFNNDNGQVLVMIRNRNLSDEVLDKVNNHEYVDHTIIYDSIASANAVYNNSKKDYNGYYLRELPSKVKIFNEKCNGYIDNIEIKKGEIFLPLGLKDKMSCSLGDTVEINFLDDLKKEFKIAAFVEEPFQGSSSIGWKQVFVNSEDLAELDSLIPKDNIYFRFKVIEIFKANSCDLSISKFQRQLNLDTNIVSLAQGTINRDQSINYTNLIADIVIKVVIGFSILLFVIVMIVVSHSISTEIEMDYTTLGILKALGFTKGKIRLIFFLQYLLAEAIGIFLGLIVALPIECIVSNTCQNTTGILPYNGISLIMTLIYIFAVLAISVLVIYLKTIKVNKISPVNAINGGNADIYFSNRLNAPISKNGLSISLSFRQFTSAFRRYISTILISSLLIFCMITTTLVSKCLTSRDTLRDMGVTEWDIHISLKEDSSLENYDLIDNYMENNNLIKEKNCSASLYVSIEGENVLCEVYEFPEYIPGILKGQAPKYDNEIIVSKFVADALDLEIGDEATVTFGSKSLPYLITGIYQSGNDGGYTFAMSFDGAIRNGATINNPSRYYVFSDRNKIEAEAKRLIELYGSDINVKYDISNESTAYAAYKSIVDIVNIIIYSFSIIFTLVVIKMICAKAFIQEKTSIGIYKALGFTNNKLRLQFSLRFLVISIIGSIFGVVLSLILSDDLLNLIFSLFGICEVSIIYTPQSILLPFIVIALCLFVFAYLSAKKINKVEIRELIAEV